MLEEKWGPLSFHFCVHAHLCLLFGWLLSGDLVCIFNTGFLCFLLGEVSLQHVVQKVFESVQVSFTFVLVYLQNDRQENNLHLAAIVLLLLLELCFDRYRQA